MKKTFTYRILFFLLLLAARPLTGMAGDGKIARYKSITAINTRMISDTIPPATKKPEENQDKTKPVEVIKEVPKARKQVKPIALPNVPVKPIKIIKPKIIRRVLGMVG